MITVSILKDSGVCEDRPFCKFLVPDCSKPQFQTMCPMSCNNCNHYEGKIRKVIQIDIGSQKHFPDHITNNDVVIMMF